MTSERLAQRALARTPPNTQSQKARHGQGSASFTASWSDPAQKHRLAHTQLLSCRAAKTGSQSRARLALVVWSAQLPCPHCSGLLSAAGMWSVSSSAARLSPKQHSSSPGEALHITASSLLRLQGSMPGNNRNTTTPSVHLPRARQLVPNHPTPRACVVSPRRVSHATVPV